MLDKTVVLWYNYIDREIAGIYVPLRHLLKVFFRSI